MLCSSLLSLPVVVVAIVVAGSVVTVMLDAFLVVVVADVVVAVAIADVVAVDAGWNHRSKHML